MLTPQTASSTWANGEMVVSWTDGTPFWARVEETSGRERVLAGQVDAQLTAVVTARYDDTVSLSAKDRLAEADGRLWEIQSVRELGRREGREFLVTLNADGGA